MVKCIPGLVNKMNKNCSDLLKVAISNAMETKIIKKSKAMDKIDGKISRVKSKAIKIKWIKKKKNLKQMKHAIKLGKGGVGRRE